MIELDFVVADAPESWNLTGAGASGDQSLNDLYPGRLEFTVNGTDLSPVGLVSFLGVVAPMNAFLAATPSPKSASWALSDQSDHAYTIERISSGRVRLSASWSGLESTCFEGPLRAAWGCFSQRILRVLGARDQSIEHNVVVKRMMRAVLDNQSRQFDVDARLIMLRGLEARRDRESIQSAADLVARVAWEYGGFTEIGISPIAIRVEVGATAMNRPWTGETDPAGHPLLTCVMPDGIDRVVSVQVIRDSVLGALSAWGIPQRSASVRGLRALNSPDP